MHRLNSSGPSGQLHRRRLMGMAALCLAGKSTLANQAGEWPQTLQAFMRPLQTQGKATFRVLGLTIYDVSLSTVAQFKASHYASVPLALELTYARSLSGQAIAERSLTEMRRAGSIDEVREAAWVASMRTAFPDVKAGDRLTGLHDGKGGVQFWFNGQHRHTLQDIEFARLFFGIWLAPTTSAPSLRERLLEKVGG